MTKSKVPAQPAKAHPFIEVTKVFWGAYIRELKSRNTLGYRAKGEVAATAIAIKQGIEALRNHDPQADLRRAQERALADEQMLRGGRGIGL